MAVPAADMSLTPTPWGPLSAADKKLMTIVRETSLREMTTSQMALDRSSNPRIRQAAQMIIGQHVELQNKDLDLAKTLGVQLPDRPAPDMQVGIDRMQKEQGREFETDYTNTLRQAHAEALILLSKVRADTQNSMVRPFAELCQKFITMHIQMLEQTGQVDYSKLPVPVPQAS
jgi:predicted outer membrane protein